MTSMFSVERLCADRWLPPWVRYQHEARYDYAATRAHGLLTIDVACGEGACARRLADAGALRVDGFDFSREAVLGAQSASDNERLTFQVADATALPVGDAAYDLFVSFETIEHIHDDHAFLREVARVLKPDGHFICSTPNRALLNPGTSIDDRPSNPFHVREYTPAEFEAVLNRHFSSVTWLGQSFYLKAYCTLLKRIGQICPQLAVSLHQARKCVTMPLERIDWHRPKPFRAGRVAEILIAVCDARRLL